jgi:hypothetical protein
MTRNPVLFFPACGLILILMCISFVLPAQQWVKVFTPGSFSNMQYDSIRVLYGFNKTIPERYEKQILIALSFFPELQQCKIIFRVKHSHTPLSSRPTLTSVLKSASRRTYLITISDTTEAFLTPILFKNMPFNAQVGVIGHELSHAIDFSQKNTFGLIRIGLGNLSQKFLDRFEYRTDSICIAHGLGYQLLAWSEYVRKALINENWNGADNIHNIMKRERYMNPGTIQKRMAASAIYAE